MPTFRFPGSDDDAARTWARPIPFPGRAPSRPAGKNPRGRSDTSEVLAAFEAVNRRMYDLARELGCLGFFDDDDDDRPRAA